MIDPLLFQKLFAESEIFRHNIQFLSQVRLGAVVHQLTGETKYLEADQKLLTQALNEENTTMADLQDDVTRLQTAVTTQGEQITAVKTKLDDDGTQIAALKYQVTALQGQGVDTSSLEETIANLESNNTTLAGVLAPATT